MNNVYGFLLELLKPIGQSVAQNFHDQPVTLCIIIAMGWFLARSIKRYRDEGNQRENDCQNSRIALVGIVMDALQLLSEQKGSFWGRESTVMIHNYDARLAALNSRVADEHNSSIKRKNEWLAREKRKSKWRLSFTAEEEPITREKRQ